MGMRYSMRGEDYAKGQIVKGNPVQGSYTRGAHATQTDPDVKKIQACVRKELSGESFNSIEAVNEALADAAQNCR